MKLTTVFQLAEEYEEAIKAAIRYGLEGEAIAGINSLIDKFPELQDEVLDEVDIQIGEETT